MSATLLKRRRGVAAKRAVGRARRHFRVRKNISGTADRPRLVVTRSLRHIVAQIVDENDYEGEIEPGPPTDYFDDRNRKE